MGKRLCFQGALLQFTKANLAALVRSFLPALSSPSLPSRGAVPEGSLGTEEVSAANLTKIRAEVTTF